MSAVKASADETDQAWEGGDSRLTGASAWTCRARRDQVQHLDFSLILKRLFFDHAWINDLGESSVLIEEYSRFLALAASSQDKPTVPSASIDLVWHQHILDTRRYSEDCVRLFGAIVHHYPYMGFDGETTLEDLNRAYMDTRRRYEDVFGPPSLIYWPIASGESLCSGSSFAPGMKCGS